jgi:diguanylate cyclase (GGDEF)-like protein
LTKLLRLALALVVLAAQTGAAIADWIPPERLVVAGSATAIPFTYLDSDGQPNGLLIDLWRLLGERLGVEVAFRLVTWEESLELLRTREVDAHSGLFINDHRRQSFRFSREFWRTRTLLFVRDGLPIDDLSHVGDRSVGVIRGAFDESFIRDHFPGVTLRPFATSEQMSAAALAGEIALFVTDFPTGHFRLLLTDALDDFHAASVLFTEGMHIAVPSGEDALLAWLDEGLSQIGQSQREELRKKWFIPASSYPAWLLPALVGSGAVLGLIGFGAHYLALRRAIRRRTRELDLAVAKLEQANAQLAERARSDPLTGVANRAHFYEVAAAEITRAISDGSPLSMAVFDLDRFKQVNDTRGHLAGDALLRRLTEQLRQRLRQQDTLARTGGDEFAIVLPNTDLTMALKITRRLIDNISEVDEPDCAVGVGLSAGVAQYRPTEALDSWLDRADRALYRSKEAGRGQATAA